MGHGEVALIVIGVAVVVVSFAVRRPMQRRLFAGSGFEEWRSRAQSLTWRDRWTLHIATTLGRAAPPRLAPLAIERGEAMAAAIDRTASKPWLRRIWWVLGGLGLVNLVLAVFVLVSDHQGVEGLWRLVSPLFLVAFGFGGRRWQRSDARRARRSADRSREQLDV